MEIPGEYWDKVYHSRLHPCFAIVQNTTLVGQVAENIGFSCVKYLWASREE